MWHGGWVAAGSSILSIYLIVFSLVLIHVTVLFKTTSKFYILIEQDMMDAVVMLSMTTDSLHVGEAKSPQTITCRCS